MSDQQKGSLQVRTKAGRWIPADPLPVELSHRPYQGFSNPAPQDCLLVNIGDMLSKWTNGLYVSTRHRVRHTSPETRISIPLFFDPNWEAHIFPVLPAPIDPDNEKMHHGADGDDNQDIQRPEYYKDKFVKAVKYTIA
jgi:isopenicillin N synthase-like dioxygenase